MFSWPSHRSIQCLIADLYDVLNHTVPLWHQPDCYVDSAADWHLNSTHSRKFSCQEKNSFEENEHTMNCLYYRSQEVQSKNNYYCMGCSFYVFIEAKLSSQLVLTLSSEEILKHCNKLLKTAHNRDNARIVYYYLLLNVILLSNQIWCVT